MCTLQLIILHARTNIICMHADNLQDALAHKRLYVPVHPSWIF